MVETAKAADKLNVFISYSRDDLEFADQLDASLRLGGFETTIDRRGMSGGEDWKARLGALIRDADTVVFALSPSSARSDICVWEVAEAVDFGKRIIPVLCRPLGDAEPPQQLADRDYIYFYPEPKFPGSGFGPGLLRLAAALNTDPAGCASTRATCDWRRSGRRSASPKTAGSCPPPTSRSRKSGRRPGPPRRQELTALQREFLSARAKRRTSARGRPRPQPKLRGGKRRNEPLQRRRKPPTRASARRKSRSRVWWRPCSWRRRRFGNTSTPLRRSARPWWT